MAPVRGGSKAKNLPKVPTSEGRHFLCTATLVDGAVSNQVSEYMDSVVGPVPAVASEYRYQSNLPSNTDFCVASIWGDDTSWVNITDPAVLEIIEGPSNEDDVDTYLKTQLPQGLRPGDANNVSVAERTVKSIQPGFKGFFRTPPGSSGTFVDDFTGTSGDPLGGRTATPSGGTWTQEAGTGGFSIATGGVSLAGGGATNIIICDDQGDADNYVQAKVIHFGTSQRNQYVSTRLASDTSLLGFRIYGTGTTGMRMTRRTGSVTDLITTQGAANSWWRMEVEGTTGRFYSGGTGATPTWVQVGTDQDISALSSSETSQGVASVGSGSIPNPWIDDFEAGLLGAAPITADGVLEAGDSTVSGTASITQLADGVLAAGASTITGAAFIPTGDAPVVETTTVGVSGVATGSVTTNKPTGTAANELVFFAHGADGGTGIRTLTPPAGAVVIDGYNPVDAAVVSQNSELATGSSEPATYTALISSIERQVLVALRVTGTDPSDAIDGFASATGTGTQPVSPDLVTTNPNCRIVRVMSQDFTSGTLTEDTGYPIGTDGYYLRGAGPAGGSGNTLLGVASSAQASAGSTGTATWSPSVANNTAWAAYTVALKPGVSAGVSASGDLVSGSAEVSGAAEITQLATGALVSGAATIAGEASIPVPLEASGALVSGSAVIDGTAITHRLASGDLISGSALIDGSAFRHELAQGALVSGSAQISGKAFIPSYATGALVSGSAIINGISVSGDGWSPVNPGGSEVWSPVSSGGSEDWQEVPKGGTEKWL